MTCYQDIYICFITKLSTLLVLGADHLISWEGMVFSSELLIYFKLCDKTNTFFLDFTQSFYLYLHFVHVSMGQVVNNFFLAENQEHFICLTEKIQNISIIKSQKTYFNLKKYNIPLELASVRPFFHTN